jgi:hypothetical protein
MMESSARSNYFKVKDEAAFKQWARYRSLEVKEDEGHDGDGGPCFGLFMPHDGWPCEIADEHGNFEAIDFLAELSEHLADGEIAILLEIGKSKMNYFFGGAWAVNHKGQTRHVYLHEIYERAAELATAPEVTINEATY